MSESERIQCRFCSWSAAKWKTTAAGETRGPSSAFARLKEHIEDEHPDEFDRIYPTTDRRFAAP